MHASTMTPIKINGLREINANLSSYTSGSGCEILDYNVHNILSLTTNREPPDFKNGTWLIFEKFNLIDNYLKIE